MNKEAYIERLQRLKVNKKGDHESPHKPCLVLAVLGMVEAGLLETNRVEFAPPLLDRYLEIFDLVRTETDHPNPYFPFFHLQSDGFWFLKAKPGREAVLTAMNTARSYAEIEDNIAYAYLDSEFYQLLKEPRAREEIRQTLIARWFGAYTVPLSRAVEEDRYERQLRTSVEHEVAEATAAKYERAARDTAFRRVVTAAYDYRCAASGLRIVLPGDLVMVQAAHLIPFSETQDDDPRNGIALTPDLHWALDRNIIAPGPDLRWHVAKFVDDRISDNQPLLQLNGKELILPKDKRFWPRKQSLEWRLEKLTHG